MEEVYWRLVFSDGSERTEEPQRESILDAGKLNPQWLQLTTPEGRPITQIPLSGSLPVFYRVRSAGIGTDAKTDAVVFGKVRDTESSVDVSLWAYIGGQVINCPDDLIRHEAIQMMAGIL